MRSKWFLLTGIFWTSAGVLYMLNGQDAESQIQAGREKGLGLFYFLIGITAIALHVYRSDDDWPYFPPGCPPDDNSDGPDPEPQDGEELRPSRAPVLEPEISKIFEDAGE